jgi:hypothetical protein
MEEIFIVEHDGTLTPIKAVYKNFSGGCCLEKLVLFLLQKKFLLIFFSDTPSASC